MQRRGAACLICGGAADRCRTPTAAQARRLERRKCSGPADSSLHPALMGLSAEVLAKALGQRSRSEPPIPAEQRGCRRVLLRANLALTTRLSAPALRCATVPGLLPPVECRSEGTAPAGARVLRRTHGERAERHKGRPWTGCERIPPASSPVLCVPSRALHRSLRLQRRSSSSAPPPPSPRLTPPPLSRPVYDHTTSTLVPSHSTLRS